MRLAIHSTFTIDITSDLHTLAHMDKELRTAAISFRTRPKLKAALVKLAERDNRQLANYLEALLEKHVEQEKLSAKTR